MGLVNSADKLHKDEDIHHALVQARSMHGYFVTIQINQGDVPIRLRTDADGFVAAVESFQLESGFSGTEHEHHATIQAGDRLVEIDGIAVSHWSIGTVNEILKDTSNFERQLKFIRMAFLSDPNRYAYDLRKLYHVSTPPGPLGVYLKQHSTETLVVDGVAETNTDPQIYTGSVLVNVQGIDFMRLKLDQAVAYLANRSSETKSVTYYHLTPPGCTKIYRIRVGPGHIGVVWDQYNNTKLVIDQVIDGPCIIEPGDVLAAVDYVDLSTGSTEEAIHLLDHTDHRERVLTFYRPGAEHKTQPCDFRMIKVPPGPLGLAMHPSESQHAVVSRFASQKDQNRKEYYDHQDFLLHSTIVSINGFEVVSNTKEEIGRFLGKLSHVPKDIVFGNHSLRRSMCFKHHKISVLAGPGPLGVIFDPNDTINAVVVGFCSLPHSNARAHIQTDGRVKTGDILIGIDSFNVSCLSSDHVQAILDKLSHCTRRLIFQKGDYYNVARTVDLNLPSGSIPFQLDPDNQKQAVIKSIDSGTINSCAVKCGSVIIAVNGVSVIDRPTNDVRALLHDSSLSSIRLRVTTRVHSGYFKTKDTFDVSFRPGCIGISFKPTEAGEFFVRCSAIPIVSKGDQLIAIDNVDVSANSPDEITCWLKKVSHFGKVLTFRAGNHRSPAEIRPPALVQSIKHTSESEPESPPVPVEDT